MKPKRKPKQPIGSVAGIQPNAKPKTAKELFNALQKIGALQLWSDIPEEIDSVDLAQKIRESQTRFSL